MKASIIKGFDIKADLYRLELDVIPTGFNIDSIKVHTVEYFKKYGYKYSSLTSELYYRYNGIKSEKYIPASLYYYYIVPYLMKMDFVHAYDDKCIYSRLFPNMKQPKSIMKNMNGRLFVPCNSSYSGEKEIMLNDAVNLLMSQGKCVIKPTMTGGGKGVQLFDFNTSNRAGILQLLDEYKHGFIIQEPVSNSEELKTIVSNFYAKTDYAANYKGTLLMWLAGHAHNDEHAMISGVNVITIDADCFYFVKI